MQAKNQNLLSCTRWGSALLTLMVSNVAFAGFMDDVDAWGRSGIGQWVLTILKSAGILIVGWFLAKTISGLVFQALCKTDIDDKIAEKLGIKLLMEGRKPSEGKPATPNALERGVATVVYYTLMLMVLVATLQYSGLTLVAAPIQELLETVFRALPLVGKAVMVMAIAWLAGSVLRIIVTRALMVARAATRFSELSAGADEAEKLKLEGERKQFSEAIGNIVFWLLMVFGFTSALQALKIDVLATPLSNAIDQLIGVLPQVARAALIGVAGYIIARIARALVENFSRSLGVDRAVVKVKLEQVFSKTPASAVLGKVFFFFIMFQTMVAALSALNLNTLSEPLTGMMTQFWGMLPAMAIAGLIVVIGIIIGRLLRGIVESTLKSIGFDRVMERLGFGELASRNEKLNEPSEFVGLLVMVAVIMLAAAQAFDTLGFATWSAHLNVVLEYILKNASIAVLILAVGFAIGNYVRDLIAGANKEESRVWVGAIARYAVLVFAFTMAVHQLNIARDFVLIAFGLLFGALCLALALAFGMGSRGVAEQIVTRQYQKVREQFGDDADAKSATPPAGAPPAAPSIGGFPPRKP
jgi:hypothetical protein